MSRRIEVELTSARPDGVWTWRAAGAKQPKGELDGALLYEGAVVGDVVRADANFDIEGITVIAVLPPKQQRGRPELLEIIGTPKPTELVTSDFVPKERRDDRKKKGPRRDGERRPPGERPDGRAERPRREPREPRELRAPRERRPAAAERPAPPAAPKAPRLRPGRVHRNAILAELPAEQKPIAEQVLRGGIAAVRQAVDKQNEQAKAEGKPEIKPEPLLALAEGLVPKLREAEWHDRADAAMATVDEVDLRDLRSVVVAAEASARDEQTRQLAAELRDALARRVEKEHGEWLAELAATLADGRVVRALRLSSRPPKAGAPLPGDLAAKLAADTAAAMTSDVSQERYAILLDALAFSPVRVAVTPLGVPASVGPELTETVRKLGSRIPQVAAVFGIEAAAPTRTGGSRPKLPPAPPLPASAPAQ